MFVNGTCGMLLIFLLTLPLLSNITTKLKDDQHWLEMFPKYRPISWLGQDDCYILCIPAMWLTLTVLAATCSLTQWYAIALCFFFSMLDSNDLLSTTLLLSHKIWLAPLIRVETEHQSLSPTDWTDWDWIDWLKQSLELLDWIQLVTQLYWCHPVLCHTNYLCLTLHVRRWSIPLPFPLWLLIRYCRPSNSDHSSQTDLDWAFCILHSWTNYY